MRLLKTKRVLAGVLATMLALPMGSLTVNSENDTEAAVSDVHSEEEKPDMKEAEEEIELTAAVMQQYMQCLGELDGYAVYLRGKDYKKEIEAEFLKKVGSAYADEDEAEDAADEIIDQLRDAELALFDPEQGRIAAVLEEEEKNIYLSEARRYLVTLNEAGTEAEKIRYRVSTLDSEFLFFTKDRKTLELYAQDYKEVYVTMTLAEEEGEQCIYRSSDKLWQALLSADKTQAWACVKKAAENDALALYVDEYTGAIALENKENGYIWWSTPLKANRDPRAGKVSATELQSSMVLQYGDSKSLSTTNLRSHDEAALKVKELSDGVEISYKYDEAGITVPVTYRLCEDYMEVSVDCKRIQETQLDAGKSATQLTLLGSFGAGASDEEGYFVLPDGCGALIHFNNGKEKLEEYSQKLYGRDITNILPVKPAVTEKLLMPVYGIVKEGNAMTVIIEEGDGNATLHAAVSGQSLSSYNLCNFSFQLRGSDNFLMAGNNGSTVTVFEDGGIKTETITLRYYPTANENADYMDIAETYRNYLLSDGGVKPIAKANDTRMYLDLYGGTMKAKSVLGIPITMKTAVTRFDEAQRIISDLVGYGVDNMAVVYHNWTDDGITGRVDNRAKPSGTLGGNAAFNDLTAYLAEQNIAFYPSVNNREFKSGNGYYSFADTAIRISGSYSRQITYNLSYGVQDMSVDTMSLLSPSVFTELYQTLGERYSKKELTGVSLGGMTSTLYGDYGKAAMSRDDTMAALQESYASLNASGLSILADSCAAYAFPYAERITDVPLQSSGFDVFDEDIPFYQIVMHGLIPYAGTAINGSADSTNAFLTSVATGCDPAYDMIYAEASDLKDTELEQYFYAHHAFWQENAAAQYQLAAKVLSSVSDQMIVDYHRDGDVSVTEYENGMVIIVDYEAETITVDGTEYCTADAAAKKGE